MPFFRGLNLDSPSSRRSYLLLAFAGLSLIAFTDWLLLPNLALGFLYIVPIMLAAAFLERPAILAMAVVCTAMRQTLGPYTIDWDSFSATVAVLTAFSIVGLFVHELADNRQKALAQVQKIESETKLRRQAEQQLKILVES